MVTERKRPLRWYLLWGILFVILGVSVVVGILSLPLWQVKEVVVEGNSIFLSSTLKEVANLPLGENIFFLNLTPAQKRLGSLIELKEVNLHRRLPSTIAIRVKERKPFAVVLVEGQSRVIDQEGIVLNPEQGGFYTLPQITHLPVIRGLKQTSIKNRQLDKGLASSIGLSLSLLSKFVEPQRLQLEFKRPDDISLLVDDVLRVRLGEPKALEEKIEIFKVLLPEIQGRLSQVEYVDVRYITRPVVKFRD